MDVNKYLRRYFDKKMVKRAINTLSDYKNTGLEDLETLSSRKVVSAKQVQEAIEWFESYEEGEYLCNILKGEFFTVKELKIIIGYLFPESIFEEENY